MDNKKVNSVYVLNKLDNLYPKNNIKLEFEMYVRFKKLLFEYNDKEEILKRLGDLQFNKDTFYLYYKFKNILMED